MKAGLLMYDLAGRVFLVYPSGPLGGKKWGIPKGRVKKNEEPLIGAIREFEEETGIEVDLNRLMFSGRVKLKKKTLRFWGYMGTGDEEFVSSNTFKLEWPKGSGEVREFPEIAEGRWFKLRDAEKVIDARQLPVLKDLRRRLFG